MKVEESFRGRYKTGNTPWDIGRPDFNLIEVVKNVPIVNCKTLDIGCGTGDNSIWLAKNGFSVVGIDASEIAIGKAKNKALKEEVDCEFMTIDFNKNKIDGAPFGFVFDRGCFHSFDADQDRVKFSKNVADHLLDDGLWLTLVGSSDEKSQRPGPPQRTAGDIVLAVETYFVILSLTASHFESDRPTPPRAWRCLVQKR